MICTCTVVCINNMLGNLEWKLDFNWLLLLMHAKKFCSKSKTVFVWEAHLSTVKASISSLTSLLCRLWHTDNCCRCKIGRWENLENSCLGLYQLL